jgi:hypothetical protein
LRNAWIVVTQRTCTDRGSRAVGIAWQPRLRLRRQHRLGRRDSDGGDRNIASLHVNLKPYLNEYGLQLYNKLQRASIGEVLGEYPGLTWAQLAKPEYPTPDSVPVYVEVSNQLIMGSRGTPSMPMFIGQGNGGELEGTPGNKEGIGPGDGVMIAGDVRSLAREYCSRGVSVQYEEYEHLSHVPSAAMWLGEANSWLAARFAGLPAPQNCSSIAPGNSLAPIG